MVADLGRPVAHGHRHAAGQHPRVRLLGAARRTDRSRARAAAPCRPGARHGRRRHTEPGHALGIPDERRLGERRSPAGHADDHPPVARRCRRRDGPAGRGRGARRRTRGRDAGTWRAGRRDLQRGSLGLSGAGAAWAARCGCGRWGTGRCHGLVLPAQPASLRRPDRPGGARGEVRPRARRDAGRPRAGPWPVGGRGGGADPGARLRDRGAVRRRPADQRRSAGPRLAAGRGVDDARRPRGADRDQHRQLHAWRRLLPRPLPDDRHAAARDGDGARHAVVPPIAGRPRRLAGRHGLVGRAAGVARRCVRLSRVVLRVQPPGPAPVEGVVPVVLLAVAAAVGVLVVAVMARRGAGTVWHSEACPIRPTAPYTTSTSG